MQRRAEELFAVDSAGKLLYYVIINRQVSKSQTARPPLSRQCGRKCSKRVKKMNAENTGARTRRTRALIEFSRRTEVPQERLSELFDYMLYGSV